MRTIACLATVGIAHEVRLNRNDSLDLAIAKNGGVFSLGDINLTDHQEIYYDGPIYLGSNNQRFDVVYDTGSFNLVLEKLHCDTCKGKHFFDPSASSSAKHLDNKDYGLGYGSAYLIAEKWQDHAAIGSAKGPSADHFTFWPFVEETGLDLDGIMGLGPQDSTLFAAAHAAGSIENPLFTFALGKEDQESVVRFGSIDHSRYSGDIQYSSLINTDYWSLNLESISMNGKSILGGAFNTEAIVDSGTTVLVVTDAIFQEFAKQIPSDFQNQQGTYLRQGACPQMPDIEFAFTGTSGLKIPSDQYLQELQGYCVVRVVSSGEGNLSIFGDVFMRNYYTIFDQGNKRVGFADIVPESKDIFSEVADKAREVHHDIDDIFGKVKDIVDKFGDNVKSLF